MAKRYRRCFVIFFLLGAALMILGAKHQVSLSPHEEDLAKLVGFEKRVLLLVKEVIGEDVHRLTGYDENDYQIMAPGISVEVPEDKADALLASLRKRLRPLKYMAFVIETNEGIKTDKIGVIKGNDQYDILRVMQTDGNSYDITNDDVVERLQEWEAASPFEIVGAGSDWVDIKFKTLPKDMKAFSEEVYEFCPDAVEQGAGSVEELQKEIEKTKRLLLWWD